MSLCKGQTVILKYLRAIFLNNELKHSTELSHRVKNEAVPVKRSDTYVWVERRSLINSDNGINRELPFRLWDFQ